MRPGTELRNEWKTIVNFFPKLESTVPIVVSTPNSNIINIHSTKDIKLSLYDYVNILKLINRECGNTYNSIKLIRDTDTIILQKIEIVEYIKDIFNAVEIKEKE